jgi:hypothetical protein
MYRIKKEMITADKKAQSLLPDSVDGLLDVAARGSARVALDERDTDWLEQHGTLTYALSLFSTIFSVKLECIVF